MKLPTLPPVWGEWWCDRARQLPGIARFSKTVGLAGMVAALSIVTHSLPLLPAVAAPIKVAQATPPVTPDTTLQKLAGQWLTTEPLQGDMVIFVFAPDGEAFLISGEAPNGQATARRIRYRINASAQPMHIDIVLNRSTVVQTVFELTPAGDLRLQMLNTSPSQPRPTALTEDATIFHRISDDTTLPPNTLLINSAPGAGNNR